MGDLLFADDAALLAHSDQDQHTLLSLFSSASSDFGKTISIKKTKVLNQGTYIQPSININDNDIENVKILVYLGSSIMSKAPLDRENNFRV